MVVASDVSCPSEVIIVAASDVCCPSEVLMVVASDVCCAFRGCQWLYPQMFVAPQRFSMVVASDVCCPSNEVPHGCSLRCPVVPQRFQWL